MLNKIYLNGILDPQGLALRHGSTIEKLADGNSHGLNIEKLKGHNVFSVRSNRSDRLLFTRTKVKNEPRMVLLDEVLNHDYAKSRFLKPAVLRNYLELNSEAFTEEITSANFEITEAPASPLAKSVSGQPFQYFRVDFYNQKFIELKPAQLDAATKTTLPLIITGAPGSGKSCTALLILAQYVETIAENKYPILYVSELEQLANHMRQAWQALPVAQGLGADAVQFKSYQQLIKDLEPKEANKTFVGEEDCKKWLTDHVKIHQTFAKTTNKENTLSEAFYADIDTMYQEFRIISGCHHLEEYLNLGQKQSFYAENTEKEWLFSAYTVYKKRLEKGNLIHASFYPITKKDQFKRIVVDEAQDLSYLQLENLSNLADSKQICYCEDNRQSLFDNKSKIPFLDKLFNDWCLTKNHINLPDSERCPASIINFLNEVARLKSMATDHGQQEILIPPGQAQGAVKWLDNLNGADFKQLASSPDFAIVTSGEYKNEAKKLFGTALVFTPDEIKGLEYRNMYEITLTS